MWIVAAVGSSIQEHVIGCKVVIGCASFVLLCIMSILQGCQCQCSINVPQETMVTLPWRIRRTILDKGWRAGHHLQYIPYGTCSRSNSACQLPPICNNSQNSNLLFQCGLFESCNWCVTYIYIYIYVQLWMTSCDYPVPLPIMFHTALTVVADRLWWSKIVTTQPPLVTDVADPMRHA